MNITKFAVLTVAGMLPLAGAIAGIEPGPSKPYANTKVEAQLRVEIDKDTDKVHFIRNNNDPYVVTKTYVLKYADPYELRPYLRGVVGGRRVDTSDVFIECIKYNDGTGVLIVSAEEYRFKDHKNGMGIDSTIKELDQERVTSSSDTAYYQYFPKYRSAKNLQTMIFNVGLVHDGDKFELQYGKGKVFVDSNLNILHFAVTKFNRKNITAMLAQYDAPNPEIILNYKLYEINAENDAKIGLDFQSWKNNDGANFFSVGGRYRSNWAATFADGMTPNGSSKTSFINFSPKWNTKYLDFLSSISKAKVITKGQLTVRNAETARIVRKTQLFNYEFTDLPNKTLGQEITFYTNVTAVVAFDKGRKKITLSAPIGATGHLEVVKVTAPNSGQEIYSLTLKDTTAQFIKNGNLSGQEQTAWVVQEVAVVDPDTDIEMQNLSQTVYKGKNVDTVAGSYGFECIIIPSVCGNATKLKIKINNNSLVGWEASGNPRINNSYVKTEIMISNDKNQFVIGGIEKTTVTRGVGGLPWLKDIPLLGWIFSTETESTKKSQLVLVAECIAVRPDTPVESKIMEGFGEIKEALKDAGEKNKWGFKQYVLDKDKNRSFK
ncbi:MAG: type II and III secretion system protein [Victivallaceae bacterium]|nr:type II and III secretion system protein [Victivallaceae bacterium]